jgi:hypothetical protein
MCASDDVMVCHYLSVRGRNETAAFGQWLTSFIAHHDENHGAYSGAS